MVPVTNGSQLRVALESTGDTVTKFLEQLVGECIDAHVHHHEIVRATNSNDLGVADGEPLLQRAATLRGRVSGSSFVYAESTIVTGRLPTSFSLRLASGNDPIGRILDEMEIEVTREDPIEPGETAVPRSDEAVMFGNYLLTRSYRIASEQAPLMIITEWFLEPLRPFLS